MTASRRTRLVAAMGLLIALTPAALPTPAVAADGPTLNKTRALPINSFRQLILDEPHAQLFLRAFGEVLVTDLDGRKIRSIGNVPGNGEMALSEDGALLYVALYDEHEILRVDTATLTKAGRISLPDTVCPVSLAATNGKLAVAYDCPEMSWHGLGLIDLADESWTDSSTGDMFDRTPLVVSSPGAPDLVVAGTREVTGRPLQSFDLSSGIPVLIAESEQAGSINDLAMSPDGTVIVKASGSPYQHDSYALPNLTSAHVYVTEPYPTSAAWSGDGTVLAAGAGGADSTVWLFRPNADEPEVILNAEGDAADRGLAVSNDARHVWIVTRTYLNNYWITVLPGLGWGKCQGRVATIVGTDGDDVLNGTDGDDVILAGAGDDVIKPSHGDDVVCAQDGDDTIKPNGIGLDIIDGGPGRDTLDYSGESSDVTVDLMAGTAPGVRTLSRVENANGGEGDDVIIGDNKANILTGRQGRDTIIGNGANDTIDGGSEDDILDGGDGNDRIYGYRGDDEISGGEGNDRLFGENNDDLIEGGPGRDTIKGGNGDDLLIGDDGDDVLIGQDGNDTLAGVAGDDVLKGGSGDDTASFAISPNGVTASLLTKSATGEGNDTLRAIEWIVGTEYDDHLTGNGSVNLIESRGGDDHLLGQNNDDTLFGGAGSDDLGGGSGYDYCLDGETHSSCEYIGTTAAIAPHQWALDVLGDAVRFLPQAKLR